MLSGNTRSVPGVQTALPRQVSVSSTMASAFDVHSIVGERHPAVLGPRVVADAGAEDEAAGPSACLAAAGDPGEILDGVFPVGVAEGFGELAAELLAERAPVSSASSKRVASSLEERFDLLSGMGEDLISMASEPGTISPSTPMDLAAWVILRCSAASRPSRSSRSWLGKKQRR